MSLVDEVIQWRFDRLLATVVALNSPRNPGRSQILNGDYHVKRSGVRITAGTYLCPVMSKM